MLSMRLNKYWIENINYSLNPSIFNSKNKQININPELKREIVDVDDNHAIVRLSIDVAKDETVPFDISVTICGSFECKNWKQSEEGKTFMNITSVQVLFPYLRQAVSTITGMSNVPQYVLPIVNVVDLFSQNND